MITVLYVDDEKTLLHIGKIYLEKMGQFSVDTVTSAQGALALLATKDYDAIISDYQMPEMDGIEFLKKVRSSKNTVPFILFTGKGREEVVIQALNEGADYYLQKGGEATPQFTELAHKVRQAVRQRRAEARIRDQERREAEIINFLPDATFAIDANGVVIAWNRAMEDLTGVVASRVLGKGNYEYALPLYNERRPMLVDLVLKDDPAAEARYPYVLRSAKKLFSEIELPDKNNGEGMLIWFTASPIYDTKGRVVGAIESIRDITDRRKAQEALEESERRYRDVVETQTEFVSRFLPDGTHVFVNEAYCRYFGMKREEIIGHRFVPSIPEGDRAAVRSHFASLTPDNPVSAIEHRVVMPDGSTRWHWWNDHAIFDGAGRVIEYQSVGKDITERKEAEAALLESEALFRSLVENIQDPLVILSFEGDILFANPATYRLLELPVSPDLGVVSIADFMNEHYFWDMMLDLHHIRKTGGPSVGEYCVKTLTGKERCVETRGVKIVYKGMEADLATLRDITKRKRICEHLKETERRLTDIINFLPDATLAIDSSGTVIAWNRAIEEMTGVPARDMMGKGEYEYALPFYSKRRPILIDLISKEDEEVLKNYSSVQRDGNVLTAETSMPRPGGKSRILWGKAGPLFNSRGEITGAIESIRDITDWRILEAAVKHRKKK